MINPFVDKIGDQINAAWSRTMSTDPHSSWLGIMFSAAASSTTSFFAGMNGAAIALWAITFAWALTRLYNEYRSGAEKSLLRKIYERLEKRKTQPADLDGETKP